MEQALYLAAHVEIEVAKGRRFPIATDIIRAIDNSQVAQETPVRFDNFICTAYGKAGGQLQPFSASESRRRSGLFSARDRG